MLDALNLHFFMYLYIVVRKDKTVLFSSPSSPALVNFLPSPCSKFFSFSFSYPYSPLPPPPSLPSSFSPSEINNKHK